MAIRGGRWGKLACKPRAALIGKSLTTRLQPTQVANESRCDTVRPPSSVCCLMAGRVILSLFLPQEDHRPMKTSSGFADNQPPLPSLLTRKEAAAWLSISERHLAELTRAGRVTVIRMGRKLVRYSLTDLRDFAASCRF
jgi:excisionase family DNA binding protein